LKVALQSEVKGTSRLSASGIRWPAGEQRWNPEAWGRGCCYSPQKGR